MAAELLHSSGGHQPADDRLYRTAGTPGRIALSEGFYAVLNSLNAAFAAEEAPLTQKFTSYVGTGRQIQSSTTSALIEMYFKSPLSLPEFSIRETLAILARSCLAEMPAENEVRRIIERINSMEGAVCVLNRSGSIVLKSAGWERFASCTHPAAGPESSNFADFIRGLPFIDDQGTSEILSRARDIFLRREEYPEVEIPFKIENKLYKFSAGYIRRADAVIVSTSEICSDCRFYKKDPQRSAVMRHRQPKHAEAEDLSLIIRLANAVESSPYSVMITDENLIIEYVNEHFVKATGYSKQEVIGRKARDTDYSAGSPDILSELKDSGVWIGEFFNRRKDGSRFWEYASISRLRSDTEDSVYYIKNAADITPFKKTEKLLKEAVERTERANQAKSNFLANMSHEIRTPMNSIVGFLKMLEETQLTAVQKQYIRYVQNSADTLLQIINDILDFSKLDSDELSIDPHPFDPHAEFEKEIEVFQSLAVEKKIRLTSFIDPEMPASITGDALRIRQVLNNLISNGIKFTHEGGEVLSEIELVHRDNNRCRILFSVSDTGIGLSDSEQENLFSAFKQADASISRKYGGTGLGLSISQKLIGLMGGKISLKSEKDVGTRMSFSLDFSADAEAVKSDMHNSSDKKIILITGDAVPDNQELIISKYLNYYDHEFSIISDPAEISGFPKDSILIYSASDHSEENLISILAQLNGRPLILISSYEHLHRIKQEAGNSVFYIIEPFTMGKLKEAVLVSSGRETGRSDQKHTRKRFSGRVLVAEDNEMNQKLISLLLMNRSIEADIVSEGKSAVEAALKNSYDLLILDINMPEKDGISTMKEIREYETKEMHRHTPVIALTARAIMGDREFLIEQGFDSYISKPIETDELDDVLQKYLQLTGLSEERPEDASETETVSHHAREVSEALGISMEIIEGLIFEFLEKSKGYISELEEEIGRHDSDRIADTAHKFKGIAANLRFDRIRDILERIELDSKNNAVSDFTPFLKKLKEALSKIRTE